MQNKSKFQIFVSSIALVFTFAFFAFPRLVSAEALAVNTGTVRICSVLANESGPIASADTTTPSGTFSLSLSTTKDFSSPVLTHNFNAQTFVHNTTIEGVPMHCMDAVNVPFGEYYYNNVAIIGGDQTQWEQSKYFDGIETFSLNLLAVYTNGLFTVDSNDDVFVNMAADGVVVVDETRPNRTVIVLNTFQDVLEDEEIFQNAFCANNISMTYPEFVHARTLGKVTYALDTNTTTKQSTVVVQNTTGCTIPMSLSVYKMFDGSHLSTQEYFSGTDEIQATSTTVFNSSLPNCLAQVDFWYGTAPKVLVDNHNYGDLPLPVVLTWALPGMTGVDASGGILGPYCTHATNTPPTITLIGENPLVLTVGTTFTDSGATAHDLEDGNITNKIVITGTVATTTPGTYTLTYSVIDNEGLSDSKMRTVIILPVAACVADVNMVSNGGFENPKLTIPWGSVHLNTSNLFWTSYDTVIYPYVEFQAGYTEGSTQWMPHGGSQYAEIDGGTNHDVSQMLATIPGNTYTISYWASPRPNQSTAVNIMNISANGQLLDTYIGAGSVTTDWSKRSYTFTATTTVTRISFTQGQNLYIGEGVFLDDVSVICSDAVVVPPPPPPINACTIVSDTSTMVGNIPAVATYDQNSRWTASIPGATWIWSTYKVVDPLATTTVVFSKTFKATSTIPHALLTIASDNSYSVKVNGIKVAENLGEFNYSSTTTYDIASTIIPGNNIITFEVTNFSWANATAESNPAGLIYKLELLGNGCGPIITNTPPTITLIGANPATITMGQTWNEPGATAHDLEDGNITNKIVITGTVATTTPGTYTLTYTVTDSGGLTASTTRRVIVETGGGGGGPTTGNIRFCSIFANKDNIIATSSVGLPFGSFAIKLATTTNIANSAIHSKTWNANTFAPNTKIILSQNDADCVTYDNLPLGAYYYSELGVIGSEWIISSTSPTYNDQFSAPVNNIFDLFSYSPELFTATTTDDASRNVNSDGQIILSSDRREHTLVMATKYADAPACMIPEITSGLSVSATVGTAFSYTLSATSTSSTTITYSIATSTLPAGLNASSTSISGTPTATGTFTVTLTAQNSCGIETKVLTIVVNSAPTPPPVCTSNCGGGGGGGGNGPIVTSLAITNEKVVEIAPGVALVTWNTNLPATKEVGYGNTSQPASFIVAPFGYATSTVRVSSPLALVHSYTIAIESGKTYYFRPVSTDGKTTVAGVELVLNPGTGIGSGNETPNACYYLFDYLKKGWDNNPIEVKKLQVFLRDLEGFNVEITGIYDDQTITALNAFQNRYKDDILTPWGHTAPTSFTYITTKKKVNEIYCKRAFPVTAQQQTEIDSFRAFLLGLANAGVTLGNPTEEQLNQPVIIETNEVGTLPANTNTVSTSTLGTLAGTEVQSTTTPAGRLTANVLQAGKKLGNFAAALFTWPWDWARGWFGGNDDTQCSAQAVFSNWFSWILIIVIITMVYLWYRERRANKKALEINEELDLLNK